MLIIFFYFTNSMIFLPFLYNSTSCLLFLVPEITSTSSSVPLKLLLFTKMMAIVKKMYLNLEDDQTRKNLLPDRALYFISQI